MKKTFIILTIIIEVFGIFAFPIYDFWEVGGRAPMLVVLSPILTTLLLAAAWVVYLIIVDKSKY